MFDLRRREFITMLGGAAVWPVAAQARQNDRTRRIGVLMSTPESDAATRARLAAFRRGLEALGWVEGDNLRIDMRWDGADPDRARASAAELLDRAPDLIVVGNPTPMRAMLQRTRSIPILFLSLSDPIESGFVESFAHPGGNVTGFTNFESRIATKWPELLKEIAPRTSGALVLRQQRSTGLLAMLQQIEGAAASLGMTIASGEVDTAAQIERAIEALAAEPNGGLIVLPGPIRVHRDLIIAEAARRRVPAIYPYRFYVQGGGLLSYGADTLDVYRRGAAYADRILRGEKPANLPVQTPVKFELAINLATAKALGLTVPLTLQASADEVIE